MGKEKHFGEKDLVLRFAVIVVAALFVIAAVVVTGRMKNLREDSSEGEEKLEQMEKINVQRNELKIQELESGKAQSADAEGGQDTDGQGADDSQDMDGQDSEDPDGQDADAEDGTDAGERTPSFVPESEEESGQARKQEPPVIGEAVWLQEMSALSEETWVFFLFTALPVILVLYYVLPGRLKNMVILAGGILFYAWGEPVSILLVLFSVLFNYMGGLLIGEAQKDRKKARIRLIINIAVNLCMLFVFRYGTLAAGSIEHIFHTELPVKQLPVPIGISIYTLQALSYTIDVYRGKVKAQRNFLDFAVYMTLFPRLIAGPVIKYEDIGEQLSVRKTSLETFGEGGMIFIRGLAKKVLLADAAGRAAASVFAMSAGEVSVLSAWLGCAAFMFTVYFGLSGFSDMALGLGKMFGFDFGQNFAYPYTAKSIRGFWGRWYISLITWFREYVYTPLCGEKRNAWKDIRNILVVCVLMGLWYGASWNFVLWGLYYGILLLAEQSITRVTGGRIPVAAGRIISLLLILTGWVLFFSPSPGGAFSYLGLMLGIGGSGLTDARGIYILMSNFVLWMVLIFCSTPLIHRLYEHFIYGGKRTRIAANTLVYAGLFFLCVIYML